MTPFPLPMNLGNIEHPINFPLSPERLLSPTLSSFWGGEGDGIAGVMAVRGLSARNWFRGTLAPNFCGVGRR